MNRKNAAAGSRSGPVAAPKYVPYGTTRYRTLAHTQTPSLSIHLLHGVIGELAKKCRRFQAAATRRQSGLVGR
jgi:hypothetical protein